MIFQFYCDESHDAPKVRKRVGGPDSEHKSYVVGGFFGDQRTWEKVGRRWDAKNKRVGAARFHATHLNAGTWEYDGWSKNKRLKYSKHMLRILKNTKGKLHGVSCGLFVDEYRRIISPSGQVKMGHPYLVCFKTVIATIAEQMKSFMPEDTFSVVIDQNEFSADAVRVFYEMKADPKFEHRSRLETCKPGSSDCFIELQIADFVAYESFRLMHGKRNGVTQMRHSLNSMLSTNGFFGYQFGEESLNRIKDDIDAMECKPDGFVVVPRYLSNEVRDEAIH